jgi:alkylated DNA repair dioxygenase AlkB
LRAHICVVAYQGELFAPAPPVPGLTLVEDAVSAEEDAELARLLDAAPLAPFRFGQWQAKRLTASYGSGYDFTRQRVAEAPPMPEWLLALRDALAPLAGRRPEEFVQAQLIRYDPGTGIGWHRDRSQYGEVIGLSLTAPATFRLRRRTPAGFERRSVELPARSLYLLSGEVRREWEHSIAPMDATRRSITFRTLS